MHRDAARNVGRDVLSGATVRQLCIGVDAMEWRLVQRWAAAGVLPTFQRLMREGCTAELASVADALPDTVWTALVYGVNPGKLEKYFYVQFDPATASLRFASDEELRGEAFWRHLAAAGKRVGVADVPHLPFHDVPNGFHVFGWGAHDTKGGLQASPPSLVADVVARVGRHPVGDCETFDQRARAKLRAAIVDGVGGQGRLFRWLMASRPWDVFVCAFSGSHCAGHHFWSDMDPSHPRHDPTDPRGLARSLEETYRAIDREIGAMIEEAGPDTRVMVVAPHGMGPLVHASWHLNEILDLLGYGREDRPASRAGTRRRGRINPWRIVKMAVPSRWQYAVKEALPRALQNELLFLWYAGGRRYRRRRAFAVPNNEIVGTIRLSVAGRDRDGIIAPGDEYRRVCRDIAAALGELTDPVTGRPVAAKVTLMHEVCHGPYVDDMPDLAVLWDSSFVWNAVRSPRFGTLTIPRQDARTGSHTPSSFLLATGPGIGAGTTLVGGSILDVAPTILATAGVAVPPEMDGAPLRLPQSTLIPQPIIGAHRLDRAR
jgi:predicted AlkP superfamily phosphohydrolase/phosphomutase